VPYTSVSTLQIRLVFHSSPVTLDLQTVGAWLLTNPNIHTTHNYLSKTTGINTLYANKQIINYRLYGIIDLLSSPVIKLPECEDADFQHFASCVRPTGYSVKSHSLTKNKAALFQEAYLENICNLV
jgi:hypothetical protein